MRTVVRSEDFEHAIAKTTKTTARCLCKHSFIKFFPPDQPAFEPRYQRLDDYDHNTQNQHPRIDTSRIKIPLSLADDPTQTLCRSQILTHDGAYQGEAYRSMQAGQNPAH